MNDAIQSAIDTLKAHVLEQIYHGAEEYGFGLTSTSFGLRYFRPIPKEVVRGILRTLREEGKVDFTRGLWTEDGEPAGSGYCLTVAGLKDFEGSKDG